MRTTQYVGLNKFAQNLVKNSTRREINPRMSVGMFEEDVSGQVFFVEPPESEQDFNEYYKYTEVEQASPWSSGPMIFTCLKWEIKKKSGEMLDVGLVCQWILDPGLDRSVHGEYDSASGRYYV